jgi:hypothetical protein
MRMGASLRQQTVVVWHGGCRFDGRAGDRRRGQVSRSEPLTSSPRSDHRRCTSAALKKPRDDLRVLTNLFTGSPALPCGQPVIGPALGAASMRQLGLVIVTCFGLAACATQQQTVGTAAGVAAGAVVAGPVGAVVGGAAGAIVTAPRGYRRVYRGPRRVYRRRYYY